MIRNIQSEDFKLTLIARSFRYIYQNESKSYVYSYIRACFDINERFTYMELADRVSFDCSATTQDRIGKQICEEIVKSMNNDTDIEEILNIANDLELDFFQDDWSEFKRLINDL